MILQRNQPELSGGAARIQIPHADVAAWLRQALVIERVLPNEVCTFCIFERSAGQAADRRARYREKAMQALNLIGNALALLTAYNDDVETKWPEGTPRSLINKLNNAKPNKKPSVERELNSQGYIPVKWVGRKTSKLQTQAEKTTTSQRLAHWRRGHWKMQPHGPQKTLRRLIWLKPTLVSGIGEPATAPGKIHIVE
jgi:hypothetical protein